MLVVVSIGEMSNDNPLPWIKFFFGLNHLIRRGSVRVIPEINLVHALKFG